MRIRELLGESVDTSRLVTILDYLRNRNQNTKQPQQVDTVGLITMVKNTGIPFDYDALVDAMETDDAVKSSIKSVNRTVVTLAPFGDADGDTETTDNGDGDTDEISSMAKRAMKRRK